MKVKLFRDTMYDGGGWGSDRKSDERESKELLIDIMMKKYGITHEDLDNITVVKSKIRDIKIKDIIE